MTRWLLYLLMLVVRERIVDEHPLIIYIVLTKLDAQRPLCRITMPFTPFHLGPGALFKGIGGDRFSFMVFGGSQVLIDLEPAYRMASGDPILHGWSHTLVGALIIGVVATLTGKPISEFALQLIRYPNPTLTWVAAANGAFFGTFSHLLFDAIMHTDMQPLAPISDTNSLLYSLTVAELHLLCVGLGIVGALLFFLVQRRP